MTASFMLLLVWSFAGCAAPVVPPELYYSPARLARMTLNVITVDAVLTNLSGAGVGGVIVSVETPHYRELSTTTSSGYFFAQVKFGEDEGVDFHFQSKDIEWTETLANVPKGVEKITVHFVLANNNTVQLDTLEY